MNINKIVFAIFFFSCVSLHAQKYETHAVKPGETLESIAKHYSVTPYSILNLNPEVKNGVKANTILIVPLAEQQTTGDQPQTGQPGEVTRFITHKVSRKETLYGISKQYNVSIADIKRYNKELYSQQLDRNQKIRIPVYSTVITEGEFDRSDLLPYIVSPKEGPWRIAYEHGITVDSLKVLNPGMQEVLKPGDTLWVPFVAGNEKTPVQIEQYNYYTVLPKEGFYRLKVKLGVTQQEIENLNPEVREDGLKVGMVLKLPKEKTGDMAVNDGQLVERFSLLDSLNYNQTTRLSLVLPFKLNSLDFEDLNNSKDKITKDRLMGIALDFYTGALMAIDSAKQLGLTVDVNVFDSQADAGRVNQIATSGDLVGSDAVIGPILPVGFNRLTTYLGASQTPIFSPFSNKGINLGPNVFQTLPADNLLRERMYAYLRDYGIGKNVIIIADLKSAAIKTKLQSIFPGAKIINPIEDKFIRLDEINPFLSAEKQNWVIVETNSIPLLTNITGVVNSAKNQEHDIVLLTTFRGSAYDSGNISNMHLSNLQFHFPSMDKMSNFEGAFSLAYEEKYGITPNRYATRGFDLTMDVILRLSYNKNLSLVASKVSETEYLENKFDYVQVPSGGYINQAVYIVKYENLEIKDAEKNVDLDSDLLGSTQN